MSGIAGPVWLAETLPFKWRATDLALFYDLFYLGALISAGITYKTSFMNSTWAWRIPSAVQGIFSLLCLAILSSMPESPRWLAYHRQNEEALEVVALTHADGDATNPVVQVQYQEIMDTLEFEKTAGRTLSMKEVVKTPSARKRMNSVLSVALDNTGITNTTTQLNINITLNCWCFVIALIATAFMGKIGRKTLAMISTGLMIPFLFLLGALTKVFGTSDNTSGIYAAVASIFLFQGSYSIGWTPLTVLYPPEVLNYSIRSNGMGVYGFVVNGLGLFVTFVFPFALAAIGWKIYMINAAWNIVEFAWIQFAWVETKGKTLEEMNETLDGTKHSNVPDLENVMRGRMGNVEILVGVDTESMSDVKETMGKK